MNFSEALTRMKEGLRLQREGWNGKGMFTYVVPAASYPAQRGPAQEWAGEKAMIPYGAYVAIKSPNGEVNPWVPSQQDMMAEDWIVFNNKRV